MLDLLVEHKVHRITALLLLYEIRHLPEGKDIVRSVHCEAVVKREALAPADFVPKWKELCIAEMNIHTCVKISDKNFE